jgi:hypothetical protein
MNKLAQRRSLRSKVWETVNVTGRGAEALHSDFKQLMVRMRETDKKVRKEAEELRPAVRYAKSALRRRDYLNVAHFVSAFHERLRYIVFHFKNFLKSVDVTHSEYLLKGLRGKHDQMFQYDPTAEIKEASAQFEKLIKDAGISDWAKDKLLHLYDYTTDTAENVATTTGRGRRLLDRVFDAGLIRDVKDKSIEVVEESAEMFTELLSLFNRMESGLSRRKPRVFIEAAKEFIAAFQRYDTKYQAYHKVVIIPLRDYKQNKEKDEAAKQLAIKEQQEALENERAAQQATKEQAVVEEARKSPLVSYQGPTYDEPSFEDWKDKGSPEPSTDEKVKALDLLKKQQGEEAYPYMPELFTGEPEIKSITPPERNNPKAPLNLKVPQQKDTTLEEVMKEDEEFEPVSKAASHELFFDKLTAYAGQENVEEFIQEVLNYSEVLEESDPETSTNLLQVAQEILQTYKTAGIWDLFKNKKHESEATPEQELQRVDLPAQEKGRRVKKDKPLTEKPKELIELEENSYGLKKINRPDGRIDEAFSDVDFLKGVGVEKIHISPGAKQLITTNFMRVLFNKLGDDARKFLPAAEAKLTSLMKQSIYNGWVVRLDSVDDIANPNDRYIQVYTRFNLAQLDSDLKGIAKIYINCRVSPSKGIVSVRGISKHFDIETPEKKKKKPSPATPPQPAPPPEVKEEAGELEEFRDDDRDHGFEDNNDYLDSDY